MLKRLKVHNFRSFLNFEVNFSPLHLVIGKNNSGKTNLNNLARLRATVTTESAMSY
jgi:predicted ATP-dependent endonuclease of OLD family